jgi:hypothetical protein
MNPGTFAAAVPAFPPLGWKRQLAVTSSATWTVPRTGYYTVTAIGGGGSGAVCNLNFPSACQRRRSRWVFTKNNILLSQGQKLVITIGAAGAAVQTNSGASINSVAGNAAAQHRLLVATLIYMLTAAVLERFSKTSAQQPQLAEQAGQHRAAIKITPAARAEMQLARLLPEAWEWAAAAGFHFGGLIPTAAQERWLVRQQIQDRARVAAAASAARAAMELDRLVFLLDRGLEEMLGGRK